MSKHRAPEKSFDIFDFDFLKLVVVLIVDRHLLLTEGSGTQKHRSTIPKYICNNLPHPTKQVLSKFGILILCYLTSWGLFLHKLTAYH